MEESWLAGDSTAASLAEKARLPVLLGQAALGAVHHFWETRTHHVETVSEIL